MIGADVSPYAKGGTWDVFASYRYQKSDRHFVGPDEQEHREEEGSQVINWIHLVDLGARYNISDKSSLTLSVPYLMAERSNPIRDADRVVVDRSQTHATGISDITLTYRRWIMDTSTHLKWNFSLGLGMKVPTGNSTVHDTFKVRNPETGEYTYEVRPVDQSIQPGDGGWGFLVDGQWFHRFGDGDLGAYFSGTYLFNPRETNQLNRPGQTGINAHNSIADQYIARFGMSAKLKDLEKGGIGGSLGMRLEGVPSQDVIGGSDGFRRPGYAWSVEPAVSVTTGPHTVVFGLPVAVYRNRTANTADRELRDGQPGDAAFADYLIMLSYVHRFN